MVSSLIMNLQSNLIFSIKLIIAILHLNATVCYSTTHRAVLIVFKLIYTVSQILKSYLLRMMLPTHDFIQEDMK